MSATRAAVAVQVPVNLSDFAPPGWVTDTYAPVPTLQTPTMVSGPASNMSSASTPMV
jgi:hypothetical protein